MWWRFSVISFYIFLHHTNSWCGAVKFKCHYHNIVATCLFCCYLPSQCLLPVWRVVFSTYFYCYYCDCDLLPFTSIWHFIEITEITKTCSKVEIYEVRRYVDLLCKFDGSPFGLKCNLSCSLFYVALLSITLGVPLKSYEMN